jgi:hypothetical protein
MMSAKATKKGAYAARARARRRHLKQEMARIGEIVQRESRLALAELDRLRQPALGDKMMGAKRDVILEGRVIGTRASPRPRLSRDRKHDAHRGNGLGRGGARTAQLQPGHGSGCGAWREAPGEARAAVAPTRRTERGAEAGRRHTNTTRSSGIMSDEIASKGNHPMSIQQSDRYEQLTNQTQSFMEAGDKMNAFETHRRLSEMIEMVRSIREDLGSLKDVDPVASAMDGELNEAEITYCRYAFDLTQAMFAGIKMAVFRFSAEVRDDLARRALLPPDKANAENRSRRLPRPAQARCM